MSRIRVGEVFDSCHFHLTAYTEGEGVRFCQWHFIKIFDKLELARLLAA